MSRDSSATEAFKSIRWGGVIRTVRRVPDFREIILTGSLDTIDLPGAIVDSGRTTRSKVLILANLRLFHPS
jgi:hypothetical protein